MARIFNLREGFTAKDDTLPDGFFEPMYEGGNTEGKEDREETILKSFRNLLRDDGMGRRNRRI